jgi:Spy/CpxP family protein refolding chaperone
MLEGQLRKNRRQIMRQLLRPPAVAALAAAWLFSVSAANAQAQSPPAAQSPSPGASDPAPNLSDQKLDATAAAVQRVATLKQDYQQRIAAAPPSDKERIAEEALSALAKAVTDQGLSVEEYTSILDVAQANAEVRVKIRQRIRSSDK